MPNSSGYVARWLSNSRPENHILIPFCLCRCSVYGANGTETYKNRIIQVSYGFRLYKLYSSTPLCIIMDQLWISDSNWGSALSIPTPWCYTCYKTLSVLSCAKDIILCASCDIIESRLYSANKVPLEPRCLIPMVINRRAAHICTAADTDSHCLG